MSKLMHEIKDNRIVVEVPADATSEDIQKYEAEIYRHITEASNLPINYVMIDSGQQIY